MPTDQKALRRFISKPPKIRKKYSRSDLWLGALACVRWFIFSNLIPKTYSEISNLTSDTNTNEIKNEINNNNVQIDPSNDDETFLLNQDSRLNPCSKLIDSRLDTNIVENIPKKQTYVKNLNVIAIGDSGTGKSALLSFISNDQVAFEIGDGVNPKTEIISSKTIEIDEQTHLSLHDTPYLYVTPLNEKDFVSPNNKNIEIIVRKLKTIEYFNSILICINSSSPHYRPVKNIIDFLAISFPNVLNHVQLVFTNWHMPNLEREAYIKKTFQENILNDFNHENIKCHFIDCLYSNEDNTRRQIESVVQSLLG